jgi:hypothetical protein
VFTSRSTRDKTAIVAAAARFVQAWMAATCRDDTPSLTHPAVIEVHEAARELMEATATTDLVGAYAVVDELVLLTR